MRWINNKNHNKRSGLSFVEIMLAFGLLASVFLPIFKFLSGSVRDTEKFYTETVAISRIKFIMDSLMFQMPWRVIREDTPCCRFEDPKKDSDIGDFIKMAVPKMFGKGCETGKSGVYKGEGVYTDRRGFKYRARVKVIDLDYGGANEIVFVVSPDPNPPTKDIFPINKLVSKDADGKYNLIKKIIVQMKWSNHKGTDPNDDKHARSIFLVGYKSRL